MKPCPEPAFRAGYCAGCQRFVDRMTRVAPSRYRCDDCSCGKPAKGATP